MTKTQMLKKVNFMLKDHRKQTLKEVARLYDSGGIDTNKFRNDFVLPRILLSVALENEAVQYRPISNVYQNECDNLKKF